ncbi:hypothetical protein B0H13DRAFT_2436056, partial [Mycena leptocephala]
PDVNTLKLVLCGPEVPGDGNVFESETCVECRKLGRKRFHEHAAYTYHDFVQKKGPDFEKPDLCVAFNSGVAQVPMWTETVQLLVAKKIPSLFTSYSRDEAEADASLLQAAGAILHPGLRPAKNPWGSIHATPGSIGAYGFHAVNGWLAVRLPALLLPACYPTFMEVVVWPSVNIVCAGAIHVRLTENEIKSLEEPRRLEGGVGLRDKFEVEVEDEVEDKSNPTNHEDQKRETLRRREDLSQLPHLAGWRTPDPPGLLNFYGEMNSTMDDAIDARRHGDQITALASECTEESLDSVEGVFVEPMSKRRMPGVFIDSIIHIHECRCAFKHARVSFDARSSSI